MGEDLLDAMDMGENLDMGVLRAGGVTLPRAGRAKGGGAMGGAGNMGKAVWAYGGVVLRAGGVTV